jgi:hypothetical protein
MASKRAALFLLTVTACGDNLTIVDRDAYVSPEPLPLACIPNLDGRIDASEVQAALGVPVRFLVSPAGIETEVDVVGTQDGDQHVWDLSTDLATDQEIVVVPTALDGRWYASSFPGATVVLPFDAGGRIEGAYHQDGEALWLHGLASREETPPEGQTLLAYEQPVAALRFPVEPGPEYREQGTVTGGMIRGLPYAGVDTYDITVDMTGVLELPQLSLTQAHRVRTLATVTPAVGAIATQRQVSFYFECFAEVARLVSRSGETEPNFTIASEVRRLGFR